MNHDDITDIDVETREDVRKGKTPRKLFLTVGGICVVILMVLAVLFNNNKDAAKIQKDAELKGEEAKKAVSKQSQSAVDQLAAEQTKEALDSVKGDKRTGGVDQNSVESELARLKGGTRNPNSDSIQKQQAMTPAQEAAARKKEAVFASGIFKGSAGAKSNSGPTADPTEMELLRRLNSDTDARAQNNPEASALAALKANANKTLTSSESEFNASMESKKLPSPTGIVNKTNNDCLLRPGWLIPVANVEAMNSDIPGEITLIVRQNVYGSFDNHCLAIPAGSTIQAVYNPNVVVGQERFNVAATVMYFPNGKKVPMLGTNVYDAQGSAGIEADVNNHFFKIVGTSLMLGVAARLAGDDKVAVSSSNGGTTTNTTILGKTIGDTAQVILERSKNISPTLQRAGATRFNLKISREFLMEQYRD